MKKMQFYKIILATVLSSLLVACGDHSVSPKKSTVITAESETTMSHLYYTSMLEPLSTQPVFSHFSGSVLNINFKYGEPVKKGQLLLLLSSEKLAEDYRAAVNNYLEKKNAYENSEQSYQGTLALQKAGVISKESFAEQQTTYETNILAYYQAKERLEKVLHIAGIDPNSIEQLTLADTQKIYQLLQQRLNQIAIVAPCDGVALFPEGTPNNDAKELQVGTLVKAGQLLLTLGDMSGLSAKISISEVDINRIKPGVSVVVTGVAFPGINLTGVVQSISLQAQNANVNYGALGSFEGLIQIPNIPAGAQSLLHVGMTAKVDVQIKSAGQILVPIAAVTQENGQTIVHVQQADGKIVAVPVVTGETTATQVAIEKGIQAGDQIIL